MTDMIHNLDSALRLIRQSVSRNERIGKAITDAYWQPDQDALSLLAGDFSALMVTLAAFDKHLENHRSDVPRPLYRAITDAILGALTELAPLECQHCAGGAVSRLGTVQHDARMLCAECDQLFATCDNCKHDVLLAEAVTVETREKVELYHPLCAPSLWVR